VRGFCPLSQIEAGYCSDPSVYVGKTLEFLVTEVNDGRRGAVVSRKALLRRDSDEQGKKLLETLKAGDELEGTVVRLEAFGAFIDLGGVDGLVHVSEIRHERTAHPKDALGEGQKVKVKVLRIEPGKDGRPRIGLSIKAAAPDPWQGIAERFWAGKRVQGTVARLTDFGAFVSLEPGIDGLVHVSEASRQPVAHVKDVLAVGQAVDAVVLQADAEKRRVSLSIREAQALDAGETITREPAGGGRGRGGPRHEGGPRGEWRGEGGRGEGGPRGGGYGGGPRGGSRGGGARGGGGGGESRGPREDAREPVIGETVEGTVASVKPFGVFIDLPAYGRRARGMLPIEEAGNDAAKRYPVGESVSVTVTEMRDGKIRLGLGSGGGGGGGGGGRRGNVQSFRSHDHRGDEPTTMAIALRKAMEKARERNRRGDDE
jgi:ribosomal protein S1